MIATGQGKGQKEEGKKACLLPSALCLVLATGGLTGCSSSKEQPARIETALAWGTTIAVAPALNFSGSAAFDPVRVADLMASELSDVEGVGVVGVNRVLAILAEQGLVQIQSPDHAVQVCERIGADAILVFAITEYDAYRPIVGIAAQLYGRRPEAMPGAAGLASDVVDDHAGPASGGVPWGQVQRVFNGTHDRVRHGVKEYARHRSGDRSPYGWRKYIASQELFLRFCCSSVVRELMGISDFRSPISDWGGHREDDLEPEI
jgi:hypothetical protein